jgi:hypothetical protein
MFTYFHLHIEGQTKRLNKFFEDMLRHYVSLSQVGWDDYLSMVGFSYNKSWQVSTTLFCWIIVHILQYMWIKIPTNFKFGLQNILLWPWKLFLQNYENTCWQPKKDKNPMLTPNNMMCCMRWGLRCFSVFPTLIWKSNMQKSYLING